MAPIILKIITNFKDAAKNYFSLLNYVLEQYIGTVYLEKVQGGFLYICQNLESLRSLNQPLTAEIRELAIHYKNDDPDLLSVS